MRIRAWLVFAAPVALAIGSLPFPAAAPAPLRSAGQARAAGAAPRNMVFILIDDLRYDGMGFLQPEVKTPNIDRLARGGAYFPNTLVTSSLCSPSRATILTGQTTRNHRVVDNNNSSEKGLVFFPQLLAAGGIPDGVLRQVAHGAGQRRAAARLRPVGELPSARVSTSRGRGSASTWTDTVSRRRATSPTSSPITRWSGSGRAAIPTSRSSCTCSHKAVHTDPLPAPRHAAPVRRDEVPHPRERGQHQGELPRQADVGPEPAQHVARRRLPLPHRHEDVGVSEGLLRHALRGRRQRRPDARLPEGERPGEGHDDRVHLRQRIPDRRSRPHRQAQCLRGDRFAFPWWSPHPGWCPRG